VLIRDDDPTLARLRSLLTELSAAGGGSFMASGRWVAERLGTSKDCVRRRLALLVAAGEVQLLTKGTYAKGRSTGSLYVLTHGVR
jgi:hypothetical protein